jgi:hypothetical protein
MDSVTFYYIAGFFFILGAALMAIFWLLISLFRRGSRKNKAAGSADPNLTELTRLFRDNKTQDLVVEMDGKPYKLFTDLSAAQQRRLGFISNVLTRWLGSAASEPAPDAGLASADQTAAVSPEAPRQESDWVPAEAVSMEPLPPPVPAFMPEGDSGVKPVSTQFPDVVGGILNPTPPPPAPAFKSIASQINDILQEKIAGTPFEGRGITVNDAPDHGVVVTLDGANYPGVKDVPDDAVRSLIRAAVLDWEKQGKAASK